MSAAEMLAGAAPGRTPDWHSLEGKKVWCTVRRLQARIVKAFVKAAVSARGVCEDLSCMRGNCTYSSEGVGK